MTILFSPQVNTLPGAGWPGRARRNFCCGNHYHRNGHHYHRFLEEKQNSVITHKSMRNPGAHLGWSFAVCVSSPSPTKLGEQNFWTFVEHSKSKCLGSSSWVFPGPPLLPHNGQGSVRPLHQTQVTQQPRKFQQDIVSWKFSSVISPLLMNHCFQWNCPTASILTRTALV